MIADLKSMSATIKSALAAPPLRLLTFTTLYPNAKAQSHGIFVETRLAHLVASGRATSRVVAPVGYVPHGAWVPERYRSLLAIPYAETRRGLSILHPRYALLPKVGMTIAPFSLYWAARRCITQMMQRGFAFDLIDAHYFYPDGVAAAFLARHFRKPLVITARGTDINLIPQYPLPRALIRWAASQAGGIITVCAALKNALIDIGVDGGKIRVLRNGVDLDLFRPRDRSAGRARFGITGKTLLSVGHLIPRKGHDLVIQALPRLPEVHLVIAGEGPEDAALRRLAQQLGVGNRVRFLGNLPQSSLSELYGSVDLLVLASSREGWANVLLEAMACGTPVVASNVWGTPEVVASPDAGELLGERTPVAIASAVERLFTRMPKPSAVRTYAEQFSWDATTRGQIELFEDILGASAVRSRNASFTTHK